VTNVFCHLLTKLNVSSPFQAANHLQPCRRFQTAKLIVFLLNYYYKISEKYYSSFLTSFWSSSTQNFQLTSIVQITTLLLDLSQLYY